MARVPIHYAYSETPCVFSSCRGFQRAMVKYMTLAAKIPHFYYVDEINCDALVKLKSSFQKENSDSSIKYTFLPVLIKSLSMALSKYPMLNSCFCEESQEVTLKGMPTWNRAISGHFSVSLSKILVMFECRLVIDFGERNWVIFESGGKSIEMPCLPIGWWRWC